MKSVLHVLSIKDLTAKDLREWIHEVPEDFVISTDSLEALDYETCLVAVRPK